MSRAANFLAMLLVGLALLSVVGYLVLSQMTHRWFARDLELRTRLATSAARQTIVRHWHDGDAIADTLRDITRDERVYAAAACEADGRTLAQTAAYPDTFSCQSLLERMERDGLTTAAPWDLDTELPAGAMRLSVVPIAVDAGRIGLIVLVHDLGFVTNREGATQNFLIGAFFILSIAASALTLLATRFAWRRWNDDLRRALGGTPTDDFVPLVRDVRALAMRYAEERERESQLTAWSPERLKATLSQHLQGERVIILANREPYIHEKRDGEIRVQHPASGLVTALEPVMRACSGVWVAHGSGSADRDTVDSHDRVRVPPGEESYELRRVWLDEAEENGYYYGFSNEGLWPLCHLAHTRPTFRAGDWDHYRRVNQKFADAVCQEAVGDDPIILVQDYHFALAPKMIREKLPRATIITFWHIPWPNAERIGICPWRDELIAGLLGSSIVGFHTQQHCNNFLDSVDAFMECRIDREANAVVQAGQRTLVRPYPISIEWPVRRLDDVPPTPVAREQVRRELGLAPDALLGVGIDRLDYTKGIEERLLAVDALLERHPEYRGRFSFIQLAAPSRTKIPHYQALNDRVEQLAEDINARWAEGSYRPIVLLRAHHEPATVFRYYRASELCYVSSLHDGMNLVAKEFVAARDDEAGVLLLSEFTGAARDLTEALIVNPYDMRQASDAMAAALRMPKSDQRVRMRAMRRVVSEFNVYRWAGRMLVDAAELRRKERISDRLTTTPSLRATP